MNLFNTARQHSISTKFQAGKIKLAKLKELQNERTSWLMKTTGCEVGSKLRYFKYFCSVFSKFNKNIVTD